jgi:hypothetical protein
MSALLQVQAILPPVSLNKENPFHKSRYADLGEVRTVVLPVLLQFGVVPHQRVVITKEGINALETVFTHVPSGESSTSLYPLPPMTKPQEFAGALTYARRYSFVCMAGVIAEDDLDGNDTLPKVSPANGGGQHAPANGGYGGGQAGGGTFL